MSRSYHSSRDTTLPPIRDVIGDVLAQPAGSENRSSSSSAAPLHLPPIRSHGDHTPQHPNRSSAQDYRMQSPSPDYRMQSPPPQSSRRHGGSYPVPSSSTQDYRMQSPSPRSTPRLPQKKELAPSTSSHRSHSYDVFMTTTDHGLVHKQTSRNDDFHQVTKEDVIANSTGKHICPECQRRFEKLSTLKNHLTTHTGAKPHECPECGKTFSVYTNMRRHQAIHQRSGTAE